MGLKFFVCALIAAVTVALPLLAILVIRRKGMCKVINQAGSDVGGIYPRALHTSVYF